LPVELDRIRILFEDETILVVDEPAGLLTIATESEKETSSMRSSWQTWRGGPCAGEFKIPLIVEALEGHRMSDHHRLLIRQALKHMQFIEVMIEELDKQRL